MQTAFVANDGLLQASQFFSVEISVASPCCGAGGGGRCSIDQPGQRISEISYHSPEGAKFQGPSMSVKFEGKPPFYLGIAEVASAHAQDGSVVLRATISVRELRPKSVPVQFILAIDVAKALAEQLPMAVRMAELQKLQGG